MAAADNRPDYSLLIVGMKGVGKSTLGDLLLGKKAFTSDSKTERGVHSDIATNVMKDGKRMKVFDTPGIYKFGHQYCLECNWNVLWRSFINARRNAILLAVRNDRPYSADDLDVYYRLKRLWGADFFCKRLIVVFTHGDLQADSSPSPELTQVRGEVQDRVLVFQKDMEEEDRVRRVEQLLQLVEEFPETQLTEETLRMEKNIQYTSMTML